MCEASVRQEIEWTDGKGLLRGKKRNFRDFSMARDWDKKEGSEKNLGMIREAGAGKKEAREDV